MNRVPDNKLKGFLSRHFKRSAATALFVAGNTIAAAIPSQQMGGAQKTIMGLLTFAVLLYPFTKKYPWAFYVAGLAGLTGQGWLDATALREGNILQSTGLTLAMIKSALNLKAGFNELRLAKGDVSVLENKSSNSSGFIARYPIVSGVAIESAGLVLLGGGAALHQEWGLAAGVMAWLAGNGFMAWSDPALEQKLAGKLLAGPDSPHHRNS